MPLIYNNDNWPNYSTLPLLTIHTILIKYLIQAV